MRARSYAKINWSLRVTGRRSDGFHDLETLFQTISLHDTLTFARAERLEVTCDDASIPVDETNLVVRAARALGVDAVKIHIEKRIPPGGGLGGGSSNAATALKVLSAMFGIDASLPEIALSLGSDVPFFLVGGTAFATGRGDVLTPLAGVPPVPLLLLLPEEKVLTREAFRALRSFSAPLGLERSRAVAGDLYAHQGELVNDFEAPVFEMLPRLRELRERLLGAGASWARMSGSGSTLVGAFRETASRDAALQRFSGLRAEPAGCVARGA